MNVTSSDQERFWNKVIKTDDCWIWTAYRNENGYGCYKLSGKLILAHRAAFLFTFGHLPQTKNICHHCDNPPCVNPSHLFVGTQSDNVHDCFNKGRGVPPNLKDREKVYTGSLNPNSKLSEDDVIFIRYLLSVKTKQKHIAEMFNVHIATIERIASKKSWTHI